MKRAIEIFNLIDKYDLDEDTLKEYAMDAAIRRAEFIGNVEVRDVELELVKTVGKERTFFVYAFGERK